MQRLSDDQLLQTMSHLGIELVTLQVELEKLGHGQRLYVVDWSDHYTTSIARWSASVKDCGKIRRLKRA